MKVSTDACIFGAWSAQCLQAPGAESVRSQQVLDIGTGTGLLTLMLAQSLPESHFLAIEPEPKAFEQAGENIARSPWAKRIRLQNTDLLNFSRSGGQEGYFDSIICNPPFFQGQLTAGDPQRNQARHDALPMAQLAGEAMKLIRPGGCLMVLYPEREWPLWLAEAAAAGWHLHRELKILPQAGKAANRRVGLFSDSPCSSANLLRETLHIYEAPGQYTDAFQRLLQPYYLYL